MTDWPQSGLPFGYDRSASVRLVYNMDSEQDQEWLQQFEALRAETTVNYEPPQDEQLRLSQDILQFIEAQGEVKLLIGWHNPFTHRSLVVCR